MRKLLQALPFLFILTSHPAFAQNAMVDKIQFFVDTSIIDATITTNMPDLLRKKQKDGSYFAHFFATLPDGSSVDEPIVLEVRGHFRKDYCYLPPLKIIFKSKETSAMKPLGSLKLVSQCKTSLYDDQNLLKEFLVYKIYNLFTDMSFRVRLLNLSLVDSTKKKKTITEHAFLLEDIKDVAKRNNCSDWKKAKLFTESTDRRQMTLVAIFQYMIGNTDWAVPNDHNIRLIMSKVDSSSRPYVVPYDFDYSGFVNTDYAIPDEKLSIQSVRDRLYRGFPRTMQELNEVLDIFRKKREDIYKLIDDFYLLTKANRNNLKAYLDDFFILINQPQQIYEIFILFARTE